jgi:hypothetical protein
MSYVSLPTFGCRTFRQWPRQNNRRGAPFRADIFHAFLLAASFTSSFAVCRLALRSMTVMVDRSGKSFSAPQSLQMPRSPTICQW